MHRSLFARLLAVGVLAMTLGVAGAARADVIVGDDAPLFESVDEHMSPVDMADLIVGRPLVMAVGSAS